MTLVTYMENQHLVPLEIKNKETYYHDLLDIEHNYTGRVDAWLSNTFISESVQLIVNAIKLFEMGYFDCAFYSLRQSLELATTMIYLVDIDKNKREVELRKWKNDEKFPMQNQMMSFIKEKGFIFSDLHDKLCTYFKHLDSIKSKLNKLVHKQGLDKFYVVVNHPIHGSESKKAITNMFEDYLLN